MSEPESYEKPTFIIEQEQKERTAKAKRKRQDLELLSMKKPTLIDDIRTRTVTPKNPMPINALPEQRDRRLDEKFPAIPAPDGTFFISQGGLGDRLFVSKPSQSFDMSDPLIQETPLTYDSLHDPNLKEYFQSRPLLCRRLVQLGLVNNEGQVLCSLQEFNKYRGYLGRIQNSDVAKELQKMETWEQNEFENIKQLKRYIDNEIRKRREAEQKKRREKNLAEIKARNKAMKIRELEHGSNYIREKRTIEAKLRKVKGDTLRKNVMDRLKRIRDAEKRRTRHLILEWICKDEFRDKLRNVIKLEKEVNRQEDLAEFVDAKRGFQEKKGKYQRALLHRDKMENECKVLRRFDSYLKQRIDSDERTLLLRERNEHKEKRVRYLMEKYGRRWLALTRKYSNSPLHNSAWHIRNILHSMVQYVKLESGVRSFTGFLRDILASKKTHKFDPETLEAVNSILDTLVDRSYKEFIRRATSCLVDYIVEETRKKVLRHVCEQGFDPTDLETPVHIARKREKILLPRPHYPCTGPCAQFGKGPNYPCDCAQELEWLHGQLCVKLLKKLTKKMKRMACNNLPDNLEDRVRTAKGHPKMHDAIKTLFDLAVNRAATCEPVKDKKKKVNRVAKDVCDATLGPCEGVGPSAPLAGPKPGTSQSQFQNHESRFGSKKNPIRPGKGSGKVEAPRKVGPSSGGYTTSDSEGGETPVAPIQPKPKSPQRPTGPKKTGRVVKPILTTTPQKVDKDTTPQKVDKDTTPAPGPSTTETPSGPQPPSTKGTTFENVPQKDNTTQPPTGVDEGDEAKSPDGPEVGVGPAPSVDNETQENEVDKIEEGTGPTGPKAPEEGNQTETVEVETTENPTETTPGDAATIGTGPDPNVTTDAGNDPDPKAEDVSEAVGPDQPVTEEKDAGPEEKSQVEDSSLTDAPPPLTDENTTPEPPSTVDKGTEKEPAVSTPSETTAPPGATVGVETDGPRNSTTEATTEKPPVTDEETKTDEPAITDAEVTKEPPPGLEEGTTTTGLTTEKPSTTEKPDTTPRGSGTTPVEERGTDNETPKTTDQTTGDEPPKDGDTSTGEPEKKDGATTPPTRVSTSTDPEKEPQVEKAVQEEPTTNSVETGTDIPNQITDGVDTPQPVDKQETTEDNDRKDSGTGTTSKPDETAEQKVGTEPRRSTGSGTGKPDETTTTTSTTEKSPTTEIGTVPEPEPVESQGTAQDKPETVENVTQPDTPPEIGTEANEPDVTEQGVDGSTPVQEDATDTPTPTTDTTGTTTETKPTVDRELVTDPGKTGQDKDNVTDPKEPGDEKGSGTDPEKPGDEKGNLTDPEKPGDEKGNGTDPEKPGDEKGNGTDPEKPGDEKGNLTDPKKPGDEKGNLTDPNTSREDQNVGPDKPETKEGETEPQVNQDQAQAVGPDVPIQGDNSNQTDPSQTVTTTTTGTGPHKDPCEVGVDGQLPPECVDTGVGSPATINENSGPCSDEPCEAWDNTEIPEIDLTRVVSENIESVLTNVTCKLVQECVEHGGVVNQPISQAVGPSGQFQPQDSSQGQRQDEGTCFEDYFTENDFDSQIDNLITNEFLKVQGKDKTTCIEKLGDILFKKCMDPELSEEERQKCIEEATRQLREQCLQLPENERDECLKKIQIPKALLSSSDPDDVTAQIDDILRRECAAIQKPEDCLNSKRDALYRQCLSLENPTDQAKCLEEAARKLMEQCEKLPTEEQRQRCKEQANQFLRDREQHLRPDSASGGEGSESSKIGDRPSSEDELNKATSGFIDSILNEQTTKLNRELAIVGSGDESDIEKIISSENVSRISSALVKQALCLQVCGPEILEQARVNQIPLPRDASPAVRGSVRGKLDHIRSILEEVKSDLAQVGIRPGCYPPLVTEFMRPLTASSDPPDDEQPSTSNQAKSLLPPPTTSDEEEE